MNVKEIKLGQVVRVKAGKVLLPTGALCVVLGINYESKSISVTNAADLINKNLYGTEYPPSMFEAFDTYPESAKNPFKVGDTILVRSVETKGYFEIPVKRVVNDGETTVVQSGAHNLWYPMGPNEKYSFVSVVGNN